MHPTLEQHTDAVQVSRFVRVSAFLTHPLCPHLHLTGADRMRPVRGLRQQRWRHQDLGPGTLEVYQGTLISSIWYEFGSIPFGWLCFNAYSAFDCFVN